MESKPNVWYKLKKINTIRLKQHKRKGDLLHKWTDKPKCVNPTLGSGHRAGLSLERHRTVVDLNENMMYDTKYK